MSYAHQAGPGFWSSNREPGGFAGRCRRQACFTIPWMVRRFGITAAMVALMAFVVMPVMESRGSEPVAFYVATSGNDAWSGKLARPNGGKTDGPFATIERARDEIRRTREDTGLPADGAVVEILGGRYELAEPIELNADDSGTAESPITYRARSGQTVRISGGRIVATWKPVTDQAVLEQLDPAARGEVFQADLKALGITEYGDLALDAAWELQCYLAKKHNQGENEKGNALASREYSSTGKTVSPRLELFFNDAPMEISRWPNHGFTQIDKVLGTTKVEVRGVVGCKEGIFSYTGDRPRRWTGEEDAFVKGYWFRDWSMQCHKIASIDPEKRVLSVAKPYHNYSGYRPGQWFFAFNLLCELDTPGEWYIDRRRGILYFWPPSPLESGQAEVSVCGGSFTLTDTSHVTIRGLQMEAIRGTAISVRNGHECRVVGCTFRNLSNHAVTIFEGKNCGVVGCDMSRMGGGGIYLIGGERETLTPGGHYAENNHIHHYARWDRMYRPGLWMSGVGLRASHNLIHTAPHAAILFGGQEHLFEYNEIHGVCQESHDCGAIYAGRSWCQQGNVFQHNYLHHISGKGGGACRGIYLDDELSGATIRGNVFFQVHWPVFLGGGRDNLVENNLFVDCPRAFHVDARGIGWAAYAVNPRIKKARETGLLCGVRFKEPPFSTRYPKLAMMLDDEPAKPKGNIARRNVFWKGEGVHLRRMARGKPIGDTWWRDIEARILDLVTLEDNLVNKDPRFVGLQAANFQLREDSPVWRLGFQRIPVEKIGLYEDDDRATWPVNHQVRSVDALNALGILFPGMSPNGMLLRAALEAIMCR